MVGTDHMTGPDPDTTDYFSSHAINAKGGAGQNTMQYANPEVDKLLGEGANTRGSGQAHESTRSSKTSCARDLP